MSKCTPFILSIYSSVHHRGWYSISFLFIINSTGIKDITVTINSCGWFESTSSQFCAYKKCWLTCINEAYTFKVVYISEIYDLYEYPLPGLGDYEWDISSHIIRGRNLDATININYCNHGKGSKIENEYCILSCEAIPKRNSLFGDI